MNTWTVSVTTVSGLCRTSNTYLTTAARSSSSTSKEEGEVGQGEEDGVVVLHQHQHLPLSPVTSAHGRKVLIEIKAKMKERRKKAMQEKGKYIGLLFICRVALR